MVRQSSERRGNTRVRARPCEGPEDSVRSNVPCPCPCVLYLIHFSRFEIDDTKTHAPLITRSRHRVHLESACKFLEAFLALRAFFCIFSHNFTFTNAYFAAPEDVVLAAEELRYAAQAVGRVTGDIGVEDVLDALFRDFCIGK